VYPVALADELAYYSRQGADRGGVYGASFVSASFGKGFRRSKLSRIIRPTGRGFGLHWRRFEEQLASLAVSDGPDRLADFALYGQFVLLAFTGRAENSCRDEEFARVFWARRSESVR